MPTCASTLPNHKKHDRLTDVDAFCHIFIKLSLDSYKYNLKIITQLA